MCIVNYFGIRLVTSVAFAAQSTDDDSTARRSNCDRGSTTPKHNNTLLDQKKAKHTVPRSICWNKANKPAEYGMKFNISNMLEKLYVLSSRERK